MDVVGAPRLPGVPPYGLLRSARVVTETDKETTPDGRTVEWVRGFTYRAEDCTGGYLSHPCLQSTGYSTVVDANDPADDKADVRTYVPLQAEASVVCSTFGSIGAEEQERGRRKLIANVSRLLEAELWTGAGADAMQAAAGTTGRPFEDNPRLADAAATSLGTLGYEIALAELEQYLGETLSTQDRMIHVQPRVASAWSENGLIERVGDLMRTELGTIVVVGAGYPGTGPSAQTASKATSYAYATSAVEVRLGDVTTTTATDTAFVDRSKNTRLATFQRFVAATWDGCAHAVVNVKLDSARALS